MGRGFPPPFPVGSLTGCERLCAQSSPGRFKLQGFVVRTTCLWGGGVFFFFAIGGYIYTLNMWYVIPPPPPSHIPLPLHTLQLGVRGGGPSFTEFSLFFFTHRDVALDITFPGVWFFFLPPPPPISEVLLSFSSNGDRGGVLFDSDRYVGMRYHSANPNGYTTSF